MSSPTTTPRRATPVGNPIALIGDAVDGNPDLYRWTIDAEDAASPLAAGSPAGRRRATTWASGCSTRRHGARSATTDMARDGAAHLYDLSLPAGDYLIELTSTTDGPLPTC